MKYICRICNDNCNLYTRTRGASAAAGGTHPRTQGACMPPACASCAGCVHACPSAVIARVGEPAVALLLASAKASPILGSIQCTDHQTIIYREGAVCHRHEACGDSCGCCLRRATVTYPDAARAALIQPPPPAMCTVRCLALSTHMCTAGLPDYPWRPGGGPEASCRAPLLLESLQAVLPTQWLELLEVRAYDCSDQ